MVRSNQRVDCGNKRGDPDFAVNGGDTVYTVLRRITVSSVKMFI